ncbi:MAG: Ig-like domain-containing protein [Oscillatoria sp. SIO1A7]|nr:Ig-like domain-containing protein [Oscillatoria sp. SIO1A7]
MFPDLESLGQENAHVTNERLKQGRDSFADFLATQKVIRALIADSTGHGHQAATINIIRRLTDNAPTGFAYKGKIEIYYEKEEETKKKIINLMPEFIPALLRKQTSCKINEAEVELKGFQEPKESVLFGFSGGHDLPNIIQDETLNKLKIISFLLIQPYCWKTKADGITTTKKQVPGNLIFLKNQGENKYEIINLDQCEFCKSLKIVERGFSQPIQDVLDWDIIISKLSSKEEGLVNLVKKLIEIKDKEGKIDLVPLYGILKPAFLEPVSHRLALAMAIYHNALKIESRIESPVIINFSSYKPGELSQSDILKLAKGGETFDEYKKLKNLEDNTEDIDESVKRTKISEIQENIQNRKRSFGTTEEEEDIFRIVDYLDMLSEYQHYAFQEYKLNKHLEWLSGSKLRVLMIQADRVPPLVFNYVIQQAGLPPVFEGNNTAVVAMNAGEPYLHTRSVRDLNEPSQYPHIEGVNIDLLYLQKVANCIQADFEEWPQKIKESATYCTAEFIKNVYGSTDNTYRDYFNKVKKFYENELNDKLTISVALAQILLKDSWEKSNSVQKFYQQELFEAELPPLNQLLEDIQSEIDENNRVNLLDKILPSGGIHDYLLSLVKATGGEIVVTDPKVSSENNGKQQIQTVTLTGKTTAFNVTTVATFRFSIFNNALACAADFQGAEPWSLEDVPWIVFEQPTFATLSSDSGLPPSGQVKGKLRNTDLEISIALPDATGMAIGTASFDRPESIASFAAFVGGIDLEQHVPKPIAELASIGVKQLQFGYNMQAKAIDRIVLDIGSSENWSILPKLSLQDLDLKITVISPADLQNRTTTAALSGNLLIGSDKDAPKIAVSATIPELYLSGQLTSSELPLNTLIDVFWEGADPHWPGGQEPKITSLVIGYGAKSKDYRLNISLDLKWPIAVGGKTIITINSVSLFLLGGTGWAMGGLSGSVTVLPDSANLGLLLSATYLGKNAGWKFAAQQTSGQVSLIDLFTGYLPADWQPSAEVHQTFDVKIDGLDLQIETKTDSWEFTGKTAKPIAIPGIGTDIKKLDLKLGYNGGTKTMGGSETLMGVAEVPAIDSNAGIVSSNSLLPAAPPEKGYFGTASAEITWESIDITVFYDFKPGYKAFGIKWGFLEGQITEEKGKTVATLQFAHSTTLGSIIEIMVGWATGSKFSLGSPWNLLDSVSLDDLALEYNFTDKQVSFDVNIGPIEMGFASINSIKVAYKSTTKDKGVHVELEGSFLWQDDPNQPLGWDASKPETTPAPSGQGNKYLDLRLLALGQHVTLPCFATANTVQDAIACMEKLPTPETDKIPPVILDANSSWLIGMDFGVLRFGDDKKKKGNGQSSALAKKEATPSGYLITLQIIFNDPNLYALRIALAGDAAKVLKGLDFQILYKKISDSIGLYKAEIALPDKMRHINMGEFNITLPVIGIEYYTNGDFQVDFGFPWKQDFSRSLSFQVIVWVIVPIPVMGSLGVYFGKLSSATTKRVPQADNGTFNPVLVFGFGIQFGLGYSFSLGILKAGFSLTAVAILEGVVAKFNPYQLPASGGQSNKVESSYYFWLHGTVGIIGKLFGTIDFAIVKASVDIDIRLLASFTFASYEPIELNLMASVDVKVSLEINLGLFEITIHFSFSAKISHTVKIHAMGGTPPWHVVSGGGVSGDEALFMTRRRALARSRMEPQMLFAVAASPPPSPNWDNLKKAASKTKLQGYMALGLTMAGDGPKQVCKQQLPCYVAMMFIDSVAPAHEEPDSGAAKAYNNESDHSFEILAKMILRWAVAALQDGPVSAEDVDKLVVEESQLEGLLDALKDEPTPIAIADIEKFMARQFEFQVEGPTAKKKVEGSTAKKDEKDKKKINGTYFPVPPAMTLSLPNEGLSYSFGEYNKTSSDYLEFLRDYFNHLAVKFQEETGSAAAKSFDLKDATGESLGSFIFGDYFLLICRQMVQSALDSLREFKYFLKSEDTPKSIVSWINANGAALSVEELFADNPGVALNEKKTLVIQGATYTVQAGDTFDKIAANNLFGGGFTAASLATKNANKKHTLTAGISITYTGKEPYTTKPGQSLQEVASAIGVEVDDLIQNAGITSLANLPLPIATYQIPDFNYQTAAGDTLRSVAAKFRINQTKLAAPDKNGEVKDLFDLSAKTLDIANLTQFKVGELLKEIQASLGLQHLSGMTSRYYMAGLRLPTKGITPQKKGMWVTGDPGNYNLRYDFAGLYALTGQQFPIPEIEGTDFNVDFGNGGLSWLSFDNTDPTKLQIEIGPNPSDTNQISAVKTFATKTRLNAGLKYLGLRGMFDTKEATYTFSSEIAWNAASAFTMPYMPDGSTKLPGIPSMQLWRLPDPLLALPDLSSRKVNPRMAMKIGEYSEAARGIVSHDLNYYGYGSLVEFTVKKVPAIAASPSTKTTYEVVGADGSSAKVLERIAIAIDNNDAIETLILAYPTNPHGTTSQGIQTDNADALTLGLAQVNLSTETRPDTAVVAAEALQAQSVSPGMTLLNEKTDFIRLLWEASITRAGGYFLYYFNRDSKSGLPDRIFNDKQEALLSLIVVYKKPSDQQLQNTIGNYMNVLVTGEAIDRSKAKLFAQSNPNANVTIDSSATQTLAQIAYEYFGNVSQVAADNASLKLRPGLNLEVSEGIYEVGLKAPEGSLQHIATHFGTTPQDLKGANPKITDWSNPLPQYTALYLPALTVTSSKGDTLGAIAQYYGMNLTALANHNKDLKGIFDDGQKVKISGGPTITASTVPAGTISVEAIRPEPPAIPAIPDTPKGQEDYGDIFLKHTYSLLSYQVAKNPYFAESNLGLPASPTAEPEDPNNISKVRVPKAPNAPAGDNEWRFRLSVPYNQLSLQSLPNAPSGLPDPHNSPYKGLGELLQIEFAWQDLYGNRLITNLSQPEAGDKTPLNQPPILTGYNDAIVGLKQWPSVAATYQVVTNSGKPTIQLSLSFDPSVYQGLISAKVASTTTIEAVFSEDLDPDSAIKASNYTLDHGIAVTSATLGADNRTVTLTADPSLPPAEITLSVVNISNSGKTETFQGTAKFDPDDPEKSTSTLLQKARGDLQAYTKLWHQLKDPYGISYKVATSLVEGDGYTLSTQVPGLVDVWLASIWKFVNDRAQGSTTVALPTAKHVLSFEIDTTKLNKKEIYKLDLSFTIERTGGAVMGDLETTNGIKSVTTDITPYGGATGATASLKTFAEQFETALETSDRTLKIATGVDRNESLSGKGGNDLWVVCLGRNPQTSIAYQINDRPDRDDRDDRDNALLFAPRPISTKLESRSGVDIKDFDPNTGLSPASRKLDFTGIDMDVWARQLFSAVDSLLSSEFTAAIQLVDRHQNQTYLQTMLDNKKALADIIKDLMTLVFVEDHSDSADVIREAFYQQLLVKLGNAYTVKAGVQYSATVAAGAVEDAKIYGNITQNFKFLGATIGQDKNQLLLYFSGSLDKNEAEKESNYTVSEGLTVNSATLDEHNLEIVTLTLSGNAVEEKTKVTVAGTFTNTIGQKLLPPLAQKVTTSVDISHRAHNISITSPKLNLKNGEVPLAFLLSAPQLVRNDEGTVVRYIDLDTSYKGNAIEHQIDNMPGISNYQASSWLNFLNGSTALHADLGATKVPMILRSFPASPTMANQEGNASHTISGNDISQLLKWDYTIAYSQTVHYPQDELDFTVNFNVSDNGAQVMASLKDAFNSLAQFVTVYPEVEKVFRETLVKIDATTDKSSSEFAKAGKALEVFNQMVKDIVHDAGDSALRMVDFSSTPRRSSKVGSYEFKLKEGSETVPGEADALVVTITGQPPTGIGNPTVKIPKHTTKPYRVKCNGDFCFYFENDATGKPLKASTSQGIGPREVVLPNMNILARQDAETTVELKRNVGLVPCKTTASDFIYTTGKVGFANLYHPSIEHDEEVKIAEIGAGGPQNATLSQHLTNLFATLLKENSQDTLSFLMTNTYTYKFNSALEEIELPVIMQPMQSFDVKNSPGNSGETTLAQAISSWSGSILDWFTVHKTSTQEGILHFDLTIFSNLTQKPMPLLRLDSLTLEVQYITDMP